MSWLAAWEFAASGICEWLDAEFGTLGPNDEVGSGDPQPSAAADCGSRTRAVCCRARSSRYSGRATLLPGSADDQNRPRAWPYPILPAYQASGPQRLSPASCRQQRTNGDRPPQPPTRTDHGELGRGHPATFSVGPSSRLRYRRRFDAPLWPTRRSIRAGSRKGPRRSCTRRT